MNNMFWTNVKVIAAICIGLFTFYTINDPALEFLISLLALFKIVGNLIEIIGGMVLLSNIDSITTGESENTKKYTNGDFTVKVEKSELMSNKTLDIIADMLLWLAIVVWLFFQGGFYLVIGWIMIGLMVLSVILVQRVSQRLGLD